MNRRLDKPSGIPKPSTGKNPITMASTSSKSSSTATVTSHQTGRMPLTREMVNLPLRKRAASPDLARVKEPRAKLRRSRSFNDIREVTRNTLKRTAPTLPPIPAKRVAPAPQVRPKPPPSGTGVLATKAKLPPAKPAPKVAVKKIPAYDYKARYHALLEKHNSMKEKFEEQREELARLEDLPEQFEESQALLQKCQEDLNVKKMHNECLERETKASVARIAVLETELVSTKGKLKDAIEAAEKSQETEKAAREELDKLKDATEFLTEENKAQKEELLVCRNELFTSVMERKGLHNQMMDLRGNIRVFCRVRPPLRMEMDRGLCQWTYLDEASLEVTSLDVKSKGQRLEFTFDQVFHPRSEQKEIFDMVAPLIQSALDGYNVCIFAYGQTGSGKTYTMDGSEENLGVIPRTVDLLFSAVKKYRMIGWEYEIRASFLEIYNEVLHDLLNPSATDLEIRLVSATNKTEVYVSNLTEMTVENGQQLRVLMEQAKMNRATACTVGNERSSRSHAITRLQLTGVHKGKQETCVGIINLVDLAGSESPKTSTRMDETKNINRSLSELTNVIMAIMQKNDYIPYRNSKLTYLLMPCLGGNSKTLMFINVAPFQECYAESIKSLRFAASVNQIKTSKIRKNRFLNTAAN